MFRFSTLIWIFFSFIQQSALKCTLGPSCSNMRNKLVTVGSPLNLLGEKNRRTGVNCVNHCFHVWTIHNLQARYISQTVLTVFFNSVFWSAYVLNDIVVMLYSSREISMIFYEAGLLVFIKHSCKHSTLNWATPLAKIFLPSIRMIHYSFKVCLDKGATFRISHHMLGL